MFDVQIISEKYSNFYYFSTDSKMATEIKQDIGEFFLIFVKFDRRQSMAFSTVPLM